jgi:hypothetical protein
MNRVQRPYKVQVKDEKFIVRLHYSLKRVAALVGREQKRFQLSPETAKGKVTTFKIVRQTIPCGRSSYRNDFKTRHNQVATTDRA